MRNLRDKIKAECLEGFELFLHIPTGNGCNMPHLKRTHLFPTFAHLCSY